MRWWIAVVALTACGRIDFDPIVGDPQARARLSVGEQFACKVRDDKTVWCWGENTSSQLGVEDYQPRGRPVQIPNVQDAIAVSAGVAHACALDEAGDVWCWGRNDRRQLGGDRGPMFAPPPNEYPEPRPVQGLPGPAREVNAGRSHTCALFDGGVVWCWGGNVNGELGRGTTTIDSGELPGPVPNLAPVEHLSIDDDSSCVLHVGGGVSCWGENGLGHVGDGTNNNRATPFRVPNINAQALSLGGDHVCTITSDDHTVCWGSNSHGQLGNDTTGSSGATQVRAQIDNLAAIASGDMHTCGIDQDGQLWCWGISNDGQLGNGDTETKMVPVAIPGLGPVAVVDAGIYSTCAITVAGELWCWGYGARGAIGDGRIAINTAQRVTGFNILGVGARHSCAGSGTQLQCWGDNNAGQIGDNTFLDRAAPVAAAYTFGANIVEIALGNSHSCVHLANGSVWCWGENGGGQLGDGTTTSRGAPAQVALPLNARTLVAASDTMCANLVDDSLWCWGRNPVGNGSGIDEPTPVNVVAGGITAVGAGDAHICALETSGDVSCWGANNAGQLGDGTQNDSQIPVLSISGATAISIGGDSACAQVGATIQCWGRNDYDVLQGGTQAVETMPITSTQPALFALGRTTACNGFECWGNNYYGTVADGTYSDRMAPATIVGLPAGALNTRLSSHHVCTNAGGEVYCWGNSETGEVGVGATTTALVPARVTFP